MSMAPEHLDSEFEARSNRAGVTLVEMTLAVVIIGITLTGTLLVMTETTRHSADPLIFEQAGSPVACTLPSHTTMFTGLYPPATGVHYNTVFKLAPRFTTLAERLGAPGPAAK